MTPALVQIGGRTLLGDRLALWLATCRAHAPAGGPLPNLLEPFVGRCTTDLQLGGDNVSYTVAWL